LVITILSVHFPGEPGLAGTRTSLDFLGAKGDGGGDDSCAELQSNRHHRQTDTQLFTGRMPFHSRLKTHLFHKSFPP